MTSATVKVDLDAARRREREDRLMVDSGTFELGGEEGVWATYADEDGPVTYFSDGSYVRGYTPSR